MPFPLVGALVGGGVSLGTAIGGKFVSKALGHPARARRKKEETQVAQTESGKGFGNVSYECVRRIDASIGVGSSHPLYLNFGRAGGKTEVGDEIACFHAAQDLGAQFTGREFDDASGQLLSVTHPEFYASNNGAVPGNTGGPVSRGAGSGIQQAVQKDNAPMSMYDRNGNLTSDRPPTTTPMETGGGFLGGGAMQLVIVAVALVVGFMLLGGSRRG